MGAPLVEKLFEGFNGTLFAYGQTGSGKTYSMMGSPADPGVIPKVVAAIFERCAALAEGVGVRVRVRAITLTLILILTLTRTRAATRPLSLGKRAGRQPASGSRARAAAAGLAGAPQWRLVS